MNSLTSAEFILIYFFVFLLAFTIALWNGIIRKVRVVVFTMLTRLQLLTLGEIVQLSALRRNMQVADLGADECYSELLYPLSVLLSASKG